MTCIVGYIDPLDRSVFLGADSAGVESGEIRSRADEKLFEILCGSEPMAIGFAGSFRVGQVVRYNFEAPAYEGGCVDEYMHVQFIPALRECYGAHGVLEVEKNVETGGTIMVAFRGRLFVIYRDFQIAELLDDYEAIGCGSRYALGALHAIRDREMDPIARLEHALGAAAYFSTGVAGPFIYKRL